MWRGRRGSAGGQRKQLLTLSRSRSLSRIWSTDHESTISERPWLLHRHSASTGPSFPGVRAAWRRSSSSSSSSPAPVTAELDGSPGSSSPSLASRGRRILPRLGSKDDGVKRPGEGDAALFRDWQGIWGRPFWLGQGLKS